ncbi:hypothetical protein [Azospirillum sp. sgz302134]
MVGEVSVPSSGEGGERPPPLVSPYEDVIPGAVVVAWVTAGPARKRLEMLARVRVSVPWDRRLWPVRERGDNEVVLAWGETRRTLTLEELAREWVIVPQRRRRLHRALTEFQAGGLPFESAGRAVVQRAGGDPGVLDRTSLNDLGALDQGHDLPRKAAYALFQAVKRAKLERAAVSAFVRALEREPTITKRVYAATLARRAGLHALVIDLTDPQEWMDQRAGRFVAACLWTLRSMANSAIGNVIEAERCAAKSYALNNKIQDGPRRPAPVAAMYRALDRALSGDDLYTGDAPV